MSKKRILSLILCFTMLVCCFAQTAVFADSKTERTVYLHAQGENPAGTPDVSYVYTDETTDLYLAVDDPNKGLYENGVHKEPQYDMNGYTVTIYFDPAYFDYAGDTEKPIDYTVPDETTTVTPTEPDGSVEVPIKAGYYPYAQGSGSENGYKTAYLTVFFNGGFIPQKQEGSLWYNLCKLPLKPLKAGSTQVFIDTSGEAGKGLELFAKNKSEKLEEQTFTYTAVNGGVHTIVIKDKSRPSAPTATPAPGSYDERQLVTLSAESGCDIYYSLDGINFEKYTAPIEIETDTTVFCYAQRVSDGKKSSTVSYEYIILPKSPRLFNEGKSPIPNIYNEDDIFRDSVRSLMVLPLLKESDIRRAFSN